MRKHGIFDQRRTSGLFFGGDKDRVPRVLPFRDVSMPSVGTRRSTRVFVPKTVAKIADSPVKLRSGKRLLLESAGSPRSVTGDEWIRLLQSSSYDVSETESEGPMNNKKSKKQQLNSLKNDAGKLGGDRLLAWRRGRSLRKLRTLEDAGDSGVVVSSGSCQKIPDLGIERDDGGNSCADRDAESVTQNFTKFGITYSRKRRRSAANDGERLPMPPENRMYGLSFTRKQRRKFCRNSRPSSPLRADLEIPVNCLREIALLAEEFPTDLGEVAKEFGSSFSAFWRRNSSHAILACLVEPSSSNSCYFTDFLVSVLRFIGKPGFRVYRFASFLFLESVAAVFSQHGIHFVPLLRSVELDMLFCAGGGERESRQEMKDNLRLCRGVLGWRTMMLLMSHKSTAGEYLSSLKNRSVRMGEPGICAIFGARDSVPILSLNFAALPTFFTFLHYNSVLIGSSYHLSRYITHLDFSLAHDSVHINETVCSRPKKLGITGAASERSIDRSVSKFGNLQKRRSYQHPVRAIRRTPLKDRLNVLMNENRNPSSLKSSLFLRRRSCDKIKGIRVLFEGLNKNVDSLSCKANILMVDIDRCWREVGAQVMLKASESKEWMIAVEHHGSMRFLHKPQEMRLCTANRYTHAMMWTGQKGERGWKLEFCDRRDWLIFKELYKECCQRNALPMPSPVRLIPIPGVQEVINIESTYCTIFIRPPEYITDVDDELGRALVNDSLVYDMDSEDEEWLGQLNRKDRVSELNDFDNITEDLFEKVIDRLEKIAFRQPYDVADLNVVVRLCSDLLEKDKVEAIYNYWLSKRKQKGKALVKVFQRPPMKRAQLIEKPFLRKKRSFKRTGSGHQGGRGKPETFLQEASYEASMRRVQEAQEAAKRALEAAVLKRRKAQSLMRDADLAAGKALVAVRIASAKEVTENFDILLLD